MTSREAVQTAEDARAIAVKRQEEIALAAERQGSADREARAENATAAAQSETARVARDAEAARLEAQANAARLNREKDAQSAAASADAVRAKRDSDMLLAQAALSADRAKINSDAAIAAGKAESDRILRESEARDAASKGALDDAAKQVAQLEAQRIELRSQLLLQFNTILQTEDTARGLVVNMTDVLFDTAKSSLRPAAREKLAKVAGIVAGHPALRLDVEGHTDSVGTDEYNQKLSEDRGGAVREYLIEQGMASLSVTSRGFGENQPIATNDTDKGRQQNRRVQLVISGEVIGTQIGAPRAAR